MFRVINVTKPSCFFSLTLQQNRQTNCLHSLPIRDIMNFHDMNMGFRCFLRGDELRPLFLSDQH